MRSLTYASCEESSTFYAKSRCPGKAFALFSGRQIPSTFGRPLYILAFSVLYSTSLFVEGKVSPVDAPLCWSETRAGGGEEEAPTDNWALCHKDLSRPKQG
jgi:hypothetical protein